MAPTNDDWNTKWKCKATGKQKYTDYNLFILQDPDRIHN